MACTDILAEVLAFRSQSNGDLSRATLKGPSLPSPPNPQDAVVNLETLHALLPAVEGSNEQEEPPHKRRKTDIDTHDDLRTVRNQADQSVILATVSFDLVRLCLTHNKYANLTNL